MEVINCHGEGMGTCRRCLNRTGWNMNWMTLLYKIKGLDGCYCSRCVKEIRELIHNEICPNCGCGMKTMDIKGLQCDICGFKYDALGNPDISKMKIGDLSEQN